MTTRTGKIARLPMSIRSVLNERLCDGEQGKALVAWLNSLPTVQSIMADEFDGRAINEQNLTEWKHGGYLDWLRQQEALDLAARMHEEVGELTLASGGIPLTETISTMLAIGLARRLRATMSKPIDTPEGGKEFLALARELTRLRCADQRAALIKLEQDKRAERHSKPTEPRTQKQEQPQPATLTKEPTNQERLNQVIAKIQALQQLANASHQPAPGNPEPTNSSPPPPSGSQPVADLNNRDSGQAEPTGSEEAKPPSPPASSQTQSNQIKPPTQSAAPEQRPEPKPETPIPPRTLIVPPGHHLLIPMR